MNRSLLPIKKLVAVLIGAALMRGAQAVGLDLGDDLVNDSAMALAGLVLGYVVKDPRVRPAAPSAPTLPGR